MRELHCVHCLVSIVALSTGAEIDLQLARARLNLIQITKEVQPSEVAPLPPEMPEVPEDLPDAPVVLPEPTPAPKAPIVTKPVVDFYTAKWCGPCRIAKPAIEAAVKTGKLPFTVNVVDIDEQRGKWSGAVPACAWSVGRSPVFPAGRAAITGWYGIEHLTAEFKRTTKLVSDHEK